MATLKAKKSVRPARYKGGSSSKSKAVLTEQARKRIENNLGYNPFGSSPKAYWGSSS